jgi:hypothetical protein
MRQVRHNRQTDFDCRAQTNSLPGKAIAGRAISRAYSVGSLRHSPIRDLRWQASGRASRRLHTQDIAIRSNGEFP